MNVLTASAPAAQLCEYLIDAAHVALVPGDDFGVKGYVRIAYASSMEIISEALDEMEKALLASC